MQTLALRDHVATTLVDFARDQWSQMGVSVPSARPDDMWAQDPEALLVFTLDVGRGDARLFDEVLDWLRVIGAMISGRRLNRLAHRDGLEGAVVFAAVEWASAYGSPLRIPSRATPPAARLSHCLGWAQEREPEEPP